jgi:transcriptional regulator with XRE-family HTH domain
MVDIRATFRQTGIMSKTLTDQIRDAVRQSKLSHYQICQETGINKASMSKFASGKRGLSLAHLDRLAEFLELRIISERKDG